MSKKRKSSSYNPKDFFISGSEDDDIDVHDDNDDVESHNKLIDLTGTESPIKKSTSPSRKKKSPIKKSTSPSRKKKSPKTNHAKKDADQIIFESEQIVEKLKQYKYPSMKAPVLYKIIEVCLYY